VANGVEGESLSRVQAALVEQGAVARLVGPRIGSFRAADGSTLQADASLENEPGFLFDALVLPDGNEAVVALAQDGHTMEFIKDQFRHCKTILALGGSQMLLMRAGVPAAIEKAQQLAQTGLVLGDPGELEAAIQAFIAGVAKHRHFGRETDPPLL
jgi:catalase